MLADRHASVGAVGKLSKLRTALVSVQPFAGNVWKFHFIEKKRYRWILCQDSNSQYSLRISLDLGATSFPGCIELGLETIRKPWNLLICVDFRKCTKSIFAYIISILWIYRLSCVKLLSCFLDLLLFLPQSFDPMEWCDSHSEGYLSKCIAPWTASCCVREGACHQFGQRVGGLCKPYFCAGWTAVNHVESLG